MLTGCGISSENELPFVVYSFYGENEQFSISNGVIVLTPDEEIFYGGELTVKQKALSDVVGYSTTFYIVSDNKQKILLSNSVVDTTGARLDVSGQTGKIAGDIASKEEIDDLQNGLFFELITTNSDGKQHQYQMQLMLTEITKNEDN